MFAVWATFWASSKLKGMYLNSPKAVMIDVFKIASCIVIVSFIRGLFLRSLMVVDGRARL
jgi:hypothetical protein